MKKLALTIGINNYAVSPLKGCINDANNMKQLFEAQGYSVIQLLDAQATKLNILTAIDGFMNEATDGDKIAISYSGHGSHVPTDDNTEDDGMTEILCTYDLINPDGTWVITNAISDNEIHNIFTKNPAIEIELFFDCCCSGTLTRDLKPDVRYRYIESPCDLVKALDVKKFNVVKSADNIVAWSGCQDSQTSADANIGGTYTGAFTAALLQTAGPRNQRIEAIGQFMLQHGFTQNPVLTCSETSLLKDIL